MDREGNLEAGTIGMISQSKNNNAEVPNLTGQLHHLPCCVKYDGPCAVSHYFKSKLTGMETEGLMVEEAYFRGRKLQGATIPIPPGYSGFVLGKKGIKKRKACDSSEKSSDCWEMNATFENITYWNHDSLPSHNDTFLRSFHWLSVAEALHKPVTADDMASASITLEKKC
ncbi:hypothetical protein JCGZ_00139 [Jatropha curcas]|uniref:Uncharacterized protein n=1 Tax=Jatropha curcas TaxID=180498 RepID=A0A067JH11_JATCU|nr:uncharacterized protein C12B10.15c [Jatropha curcas]KDP23147.1 hypothetical protein JCGZ_00139 [Jatropha curcas]